MVDPPSAHAGSRRGARSFLAACAAKAFPDPGHRGWWIVAAGFAACLFSSPGQTFLFSLFVEPILADTGIERVALSTAYAIATLGAACLLPAAGLAADRLSPRVFFLGVFLGMGAALVGLAVSSSLAMIGAMTLLLRLLGQGAIAVGVVKATTMWFTDYRGRALAIGTVGFAAGELVLPGAVQWLIAAAGWRGVMAGMGVLYLAVLAPAFAAAIRAPARPAGGRRAPDADPPGFQPKGRMGDAAFWLLLLGMSLQPFVMTGLIFHQGALVLAWDWGLGSMAAILACFALLRILSTIAGGFLFERIAAEWNIPLSCAAVVAACLWTRLGAGGLAGPLAYGSLLGLGAGIGSAGNTILWQERYGVSRLGAVQGTVSAVRNGATALAPPAAAMMLAAAASPALLMDGVLAASLAIAAIPLASRRLDRRAAARRRAATSRGAEPSPC